MSGTSLYAGTKMKREIERHKSDGEAGVDVERGAEDVKPATVEDMISMGLAKMIGKNLHERQLVDPHLRPLHMIRSMHLHDMDAGLILHVSSLLVCIKTGGRFHLRFYWKNVPLQMFFREEIYVGKEESSNCSILCLRNNRPFEIKIFCPNGDLVFILRRKYSCCLCFWGTRIFGSEIFVDYVGTKGSAKKRLGVVRQRFSINVPKYSIFDETGREIMDIQGPRKGCPSLVHPHPNQDFSVFQVLQDDSIEEDEQVGKIYMELEGEQEVNESADDLAGKTIRMSLGVKTDRKLSPGNKALILAASVCIDFNYFGEGCCGPLAGFWILIIVITLSGILGTILLLRYLQ